MSAALRPALPRANPHFSPGVGKGLPGNLSPAAEKQRLFHMDINI
jgi:hypothetical protein